MLFVTFPPSNSQCVLDSARHMQQQGFDVTYLPVRPDGLLELDALAAAIRPDTCLVSVMAVNNEIGVVQPLAAIGKLCRQHKVLFHTDAAQALGKLPLDVQAMGIDAMSLSAHKVLASLHFPPKLHRLRPAQLTKNNFINPFSGIWPQGRGRALSAPPPAGAPRGHHQRCALV